MTVPARPPSTPFAINHGARIVCGLFVAVTLFGGCGPLECTLIGCLEGMSLSFSDELPPGGYQIDVTTSSGEVAHCDLNVMPEPDDGAYLTTRTCTGDFQINAEAKRLFIFGTPEEATVSVTRTETGVSVSENYTPEYAVNQPNGPDCGPGCQYAQGFFDSTELIASPAPGPGGAGGSEGS